MTRLLDSFRSRQTTRALPTSQDTMFMSSWAPSPGMEKVTGVYSSYAQEGYASNAVVFAVLNARLMLFSQARFKFRRLSDKSIFGDTSLVTLEHPWPGGSTAELLSVMIQDADVAGNAFIRIDDSGTLERLRPDRVTIMRLLGDDMTAPRVEGYLFDREGSGLWADAEFHPVDKVAHWSPIPDPLSPFRGMSWLTPVVREINADAAMVVHRQKYFEQAATPNLLVKYSQKLSTEGLRRLSERFAARYAGADNAYRTLVLDEGADATVIGRDMQQASFVEVQSAGENRIAAASGVPPIVAGLKEGLQAATYSNYQQAWKAFANGTIRWLWNSACTPLSHLVPPPTGAELWVDTSDIPSMRDDETARAEARRTNAAAIGEFIRAGFDPDTVIPAIVADDLTLLSHSGAIPTALYPDGQAPSTTGGQ